MRLILGPRAFVHVPEVDVAVAERVPPGIHHFRIEAQNAFARNVWRCGICFRASDKRVPSSALRSCGVIFAKSNLAKASRKEGEASSKYGVPGPILGRV